MWTTVLVMALAVIFEPVRLGLGVLMLNRRRPILQLLAYLCGGFTMGIGVGVVLLFILRATPLAGRFTVPQAQIVAGLLALLVAVALAVNVPARRLIRRAPAASTVGGGAGDAAESVVESMNVGLALLEPVPAGRLKKVSGHARRFLQGNSLVVAWVSGLGVALPSANYLGAMAAILASGASPATQTQALVVFNAVAFALVEIPLISFLVAPQKTRTVMTALQAWLKSRSHRDLGLLLAAGGCFLLVLGLSSL